MNDMFLPNCGYLPKLDLTDSLLPRVENKNCIFNYWKIEKTYSDIWEKSFIDMKYDFLKSNLDISPNSIENIKNINLELKDENPELSEIDLLNLTDSSINKNEIFENLVDKLWEYNRKTNTISLYLWTIKKIVWTYLNWLNHTFIANDFNSIFELLVNAVIVHEIFHSIHPESMDHNNHSWNFNDYLLSDAEKYSRINTASVYLWGSSELKREITLYLSWNSFVSDNFWFISLLPIIKYYKSKNNINWLFDLIDKLAIKKKKLTLNDLN